MQTSRTREGFDAQPARLPKVADRGSYVNESRLRHVGKAASRDRVYKAITYMLVSRLL